jgi:serine protease Do
MKRGIALAAGAAALVAAGLVGLPAARAGEKEKEKDAERKVERRIEIRHAGGGSFLGVGLDDLPGDGRGATVRSVEEGSAAAKAGLKEGDVIVRFDGEAVRSASQLARLVRETPAGRSVPIELTRDGAKQQVTATLAEGGPRHLRFFGGGGGDVWDLEVPEPPAVAPVPPVPPMPGGPRVPAPRAFRWEGGGDDLLFHVMPGGPRRLGVSYVEVGEQLAAHYKLTQKGGVLVTSVDEGSPAARAGLKAGDVILEVGSQAIEDGADLREAVAKAEDGQPVTIMVQRDGRPTDVSVTLEKRERRRARSPEI